MEIMVGKILKCLKTQKGALRDPGCLLASFLLLPKQRRGFCVV